MKANLIQIPVVLLAALAPLSAEAPSGFIESSSNFVRADTVVDLNWKINLPAVLTEFVDFENEENQIEAKTNLLAEVRVLGAAMGPSANPMFGEALVHAGNSSWNTIFLRMGRRSRSDFDQHLLPHHRPDSRF